MKVIVIGATGIIGNAISQHLRTNGHEVIPVSRSTQPAMDLENPKSINTLFSEVGAVDAIICAAGNASFGAFNQLSDEDFQLGLDSKLMGQVNVCREGLRILNPNGKLILTGGIFAHNPWPNTSNIAMVNAALEGFVKALALEMPDDQKVSVVHPPFVRESAISMGMEGDPHPPALEVALAYIEALDRDANGEAIYVQGYETE